MVPKKWVVFSTMSAVCLLLLFQLYRYRFSNVGIVSIPSYNPAPIVDNVHSYWSKRPQHYPLKSLIPLPTGKPQKMPRVQHQFNTETNSQRAARLSKRDEVKSVFLRCWNSYRQRAWMQDELSPISGHGRNSFGGWSATLVDALDTLWIMGLQNEFKEAAKAAQSIDFSKSSDSVVNVFETTIRYLGGFLASYDLSGDMSLLHKAVEVGEMLLVPFDTPNHLPITRWEWQKAANGQTQEAPSSMLVSELGSLSLEFTRLTQLTGDDRWYDAIARISNLFYSQQQSTKLPGMWPVVINPKKEDLTGDTGFTLGGMSDSLYEYFPKEYALLGGLVPQYEHMYKSSMAAATDALFFRPMTPNSDDILISGDARASSDGKSYTTDPKGQHLGCFTGGMLALGGRLFSDEQHVMLGRKLTDGCIWAYHTMSRGIMPEIAHFVPCESKTTCPWEDDKWKAAILKHEGSNAAVNVDSIIQLKNLPRGYTSIDDHRYILRPEAIESVFILYRVTGDEAYREAAWEMFQAIRNVTQTDLANAAISDITIPPHKGGAPKDDRMESFWLAETLKYFYLIFSEPDLINLDDYVLNTEAHPFRRPK